MKTPCAVCGCSGWDQVYAGPVRQGKFGCSVSGVVWRCQGCNCEFLPPQQQDVLEYYQSRAYRDELGESADVEAYFKLHDAEQFQKYGLLNSLSIRGKVIADIGCGGGSFLDGVKGFAAKTIAIEPGKTYHDSLKARGHQVYSFATDARKEWANKIDVAVSFSVIEHLEKPVDFLKDARDLLAEDGVLIISTPNRRDILVQLSAEYRAFFYRTVHIWYLDENSLSNMAKAAGFSEISFKFNHRFNFSNFTNWLQEKRPTGNKNESPIGRDFDEQWKLSLEQRGVSDYIYAILRVR